MCLNSGLLYGEREGGQGNTGHKVVKLKLCTKKKMSVEVHLCGCFPTTAMFI